MNQPDQFETQENSAFKAELDRLESIYQTQIEEIQADYQTKRAEYIKALIIEKSQLEKKQSKSVAMNKFIKLMQKYVDACKILYSQQLDQKQIAIEEFMDKIIVKKELKATQAEKVVHDARVLAQEELKILEDKITALQNLFLSNQAIRWGQTILVGWQAREEAYKEINAHKAKMMAMKGIKTKKTVLQTKKTAVKGQEKTEKAMQQKQMGIFGFLKKKLGLSSESAQLTSNQNSIVEKEKYQPSLQHYKQEDEQTISFLIGFQNSQKEKNQ